MYDPSTILRIVEFVDVVAGQPQQLLQIDAATGAVANATIAGANAASAGANAATDGKVLATALALLMLSASM